MLDPSYALLYNYVSLSSRYYRVRADVFSPHRLSSDPIALATGSTLEDHPDPGGATLRVFHWRMRLKAGAAQVIVATSSVK